jgi:hypothetical protein
MICKWWESTSRSRFINTRTQFVLLQDFEIQALARQSMFEAKAVLILIFLRLNFSSLPPYK